MNEATEHTTETPTTEAESKVVGMDGKPKNNGVRRRQEKEAAKPEPPAEPMPYGTQFMPMGDRLHEQIIEIIGKLDIFQERFADAYSDKFGKPPKDKNLRFEVRINPESDRLELRWRELNDDEKRALIAQMEAQRAQR